MAFLFTFTELMPQNCLIVFWITPLVHILSVPHTLRALTTLSFLGDILLDVVEFSVDRHTSNSSEVADWVPL